MSLRLVPAIDLPRHINEVFVEEYVRQALVRLNPDIAACPERAEEVLYKLRAIVLSVRSDGLIRANEEFTAWLRGERSMPFGQNNEKVSIRLVDFDDLDQNQYIATTQLTYRAGSAERRADFALFVNGFPLALIAVSLLNLGFIAYAVALYRNYSDALAKRTFRYSIMYLTLLFAALFADRLFA